MVINKHEISYSTPPLEVAPQELYHAKSFWTRYIFCQDAKVIGIQYAITATAIGIVGVVLSWLMRLQLGFPEISFISDVDYYQFITMHGMIMVVYLLTALFLGGFGNYLIPLMVGARDMVFPFLNMISYWVFLFGKACNGVCNATHATHPCPAAGPTALGAGRRTAEHSTHRLRRPGLPRPWLLWLR